LQTRLLQGVGLAVAFAAAMALPAIASVTGALSQEDNVALQLEEQPPPGRALIVTSRLPPLGREPEGVDAVVAGFSRVTEPVRRVRVFNPVAPADERGVRLVVAENQAARREVVLTEGRLPGPCMRDVCEGVALRGATHAGAIDLPNGVRLRITGRAFISSRALPDPTLLGEAAVLVPRTDGPLAAALLDVGSGVVSTAVLEPNSLHGFEVPALAEAMRRAIIRVERLDSLDRVTAPLPLLEDMEDRGGAARGRLLLVAAQAAALIVAFAAFMATMRRRDAALLEQQLATFGAGRFGSLLARSVEIALPAATGALLALAGVLAGTVVAARSRGLSSEFVAAALPPSTVLAVLAVAVLATIIVVAAGRSIEQRRRGFGALEIGAIAALGVTIWQAVETGSLDPGTVARGGGGPSVLLLPALMFFVSAVVLLRVLPLAFRGGEIAARRFALTFRLALLSATRRPALAAAATTFLAVALGTAIFSLNYRATLTQQARDEAAFRAGAAWRVLERRSANERDVFDVSPLTRYSSISTEAPTPVLRLRASLHEAEVTGESRSLTLLGVPAERLPRIEGWRGDFASASPAELSRLLQSQRLRLTGPMVARDATALRVWVRAETLRPREFVAHLLLPGQSFERLSLGRAPTEWRRVTIDFPERLRGSQIIGLDFPALDSSEVVDPGYVDFAGLAVRREGGWERLATVTDWVAAPSPFGAAAAAGPQVFGEGPVRRGMRLSINGSPVTLLRPSVQLSARALVSRSLARAAVDGRLMLDIPAAGLSLPIQIVGEARLFPTVVTNAGAFAVADYDTLFAILNVDQPGAAPPSEAWFFVDQPAHFEEALASRPFRTEEVISAQRLERRLLQDPLAAGARRVLLLGAVAAALLGVLGLVVATRTALRDERALFAEYEALGVPPASLARSTQVRIALLTVLGLVAGLVGGLATVGLISALVAVTGSATAPLPPIRTAIAWPLSLALLAVVGTAAFVVAGWLAARELRSSTGGRLRA
jgi:hypothetical protein